MSVEGTATGSGGSAASSGAADDRAAATAASGLDENGASRAGEGDAAGASGAGEPPSDDAPDVHGQAGATDQPPGGAAPASSAEWAAVQEELRTLRQELAEARASLAEAQERADRYHANWQRSAADFLNWKRRAEAEKADATRLGEASVIGDALRVLDDFERAFAALPSELRRLTWIEGVHLIWGKLFAIFEARGLAPIEAQGREFDPREHEAVLREEDADSSELTHVVQELQRGYRLGDRVLRPTLVKVGRPPSAGGGEPAGEAGANAAGTERASDAGEARGSDGGAGGGTG